MNVGAIEEFDRVNQRYTYLTGQRDDVQQAKGELTGIIEEIRLVALLELCAHGRSLPLQAQPLLLERAQLLLAALMLEPGGGRLAGAPADLLLIRGNGGAVGGHALHALLPVSGQIPLGLADALQALPDRGPRPAWSSA